MEKLTKKEQEIYDCIICFGLTNAELARRFNVNVRTIETHLTNILGKKQVDNQKQLIIKHYSEGI